MSILEERRRFTFTIVENEIIDNVDLYSKNEVMAYTVIARYANSESSCFPSYNTIAEKMRCSRRTAIDAINSLVEKGVIKKEVRKNKKTLKNETNVYTLVGAKGVKKTKEVSEEISKQREEKNLRVKQIKELDENENVVLIKKYLPDLRMGRNQKLEIVKLNYEILEETVNRTAFNGGKSFKYLIMTYETVKEEMKEKEKEEKLKKVIEEKNKRSFVNTSEHQSAYINFLENGYESLNLKEKILIQELEENGIIKNIS